MTSNIQREISRTIPTNIPARFTAQETPLFTAYGCVLVERDTGKSYVYKAINLRTGVSEVISRRDFPLTTSGVEAMAEKIRKSSIAGAGSLEADRPFGDKIGLDSCLKTLAAVFKEILPQYGYIKRKEQLALAEHILAEISLRHITLAESEVGTGKTLAYLAAAIIAKRGRLNGYWNMSFYTGTPYLEMEHMPIVVATSSIALQKALITDAIPTLSSILLEHGIIRKPLTAVVRKGREHYACERNLRTHIRCERDTVMRQTLGAMLEPCGQIDLAEADGLTAYVKRKIAVPSRCDRSCPYRDTCAYLSFREKAQAPDIDIQVCNHNYLLADTLRRSREETPLIPNYQMIVIDEAHKFLAAARSMYGTELSSLSLDEIRSAVLDLKLVHGLSEKYAHRLVRLLSSESNRLFRLLTESVRRGNAHEDASRLPVAISEDMTHLIRKIQSMSGELIDVLTAEKAAGNGSGRKRSAIWELENVRSQAAALAGHNELICWLETDAGEKRLCGIPKNLDERLHNDLWSNGIPTVLTSGTLSAGGDFSHVKRSLGLHFAGNRVTETSKPSPFDYRKNALLYISDLMPFPEKNDQKYINALTKEIERLIRVSNGHAAVLFTSYNAMGRVYKKLREGGLPFPLLRLDRGGVREIELFKQSGNGVLFASGALWEGIDIPGDALSMLIIVKLPFAVPDPIGEYERTLYASVQDYKTRVVTPEMLVKLKQGFGRLIRTEWDSGCVAILDSRAGIFGKYRGKVLDALPNCKVTGKTDEIEAFYRAVKSPDFFG